ncbi:MAG TPA: DUF2378 family protein [Polyangiaceae bacterium LLY-WYZ-15_(1-7)]|nr:DUF2378 family protein [Polyangiaceae bacterium LLY-WYZ-15_(1-7)]
MGELRCKGLMLKNRAALLGEQCDAETELHPRLSAELRDGLAYGRIVSGGWYPIAWLRELHRAGTEATGRGEDLAWELGSEGARRNFKTVHRVFLSVLSPSAILKRAPRVFGAYFDGGRYEVTRADSNAATIEISECPGFDIHTWQAIAGTAHAGLEMCGAKDVQTAVQPAPGLARGTLSATWR